MMYLLRYFFRFLASKAFVLFVLVTALSLFIWFAGPLFAFANHRPLELASVRWRVIFFLFICYLLWLLCRIWFRLRLGERLINRMSRIKGSLENQRRTSEVSTAQRMLQDRFDQALKTMKTMHRPAKLRRLLWGRRSAYDLPWYVVMGAPGAGKTSALLNSGLDFPLAGQFGKTALKDVLATPNCEWWFSDHAALIDTAGRYVVQNSATSDDSEEWRGFLSLLKKHRPRQPLNGVLLTLSADNLMAMSDESMITQLSALRERINEVQQEFPFRIPVYVCVTKLDLLGGFNEFFAGFNKTQRDQVLGFTLPYIESEKNQTSAVASFEQLWDGVEKSLFGVQDGHLAREMDLRRRNQIYAFSQQFAGLRVRLMHAVEFIFAQSKLIQQPLLRGVYLCSATQSGATLDRVFSGLAEHFDSAGTVPTMSLQETGRSYFLRDLLTNVIFNEAHLAGRNVRWEKRDRYLVWSSYGLSLALLLVALGVWTLSYGNNDRFLENARTHSEQLSKSLKGYQTDGGNLETLLTLLDDVKAMGDMPEFLRVNPPLEYRYGLYQGAKVDVAIDRAYERLLDNGLQPLISKRIEAQLRNPPVGNIEYLYESLKAYLMLHDAEHYSAEFMRQWVAADVKRFVLPDADPETLQRVDRHIEALLANEHSIRTVQPMDDVLVADARRRLSSLSTAQRAYVRLRDRLMRTNDIAEFNMLDVAGPQAANVFVRRSGQPLNRGVPGLFTYHGYWSLFDKSLSSVVDEVGEDEGWVLGLPGKDVRSQAGDIMRGKLVREVRMLFLREYQQVWAQYLQDFQLVASGSLSGSIQRMSVLSAPDSPLPLFMRGVVKETTLLREADRGPQTVVDRVASKIKNTRDDIERVIGPMEFARSAQENKDERIVDDYFAALRRVVGPPGSPNQSGQPIDALMKTLDEYYSMLMATDSAMRTGMSPPTSDVAVRLKSEASRLPAPFGKMLGMIEATSSQQTSSLVRNQIGANLNANVGDFCRRAIEGRYPLNKASASDVTPQDFARFFGNNGIMQEFFNKNLAPVVDPVTWTYKRGSDAGVQGSDESLSAFQKANVIRSVFFASGEPQPRLKLDIKVVEMDTSIVSIALDVDGAVLRYAHGPQLSQTITWPGPRGRQDVSLQVSDNLGAQIAMKTEGSWALHRFFDKLAIVGAIKPETFTATALVNSRKVIFEVTVSSVENPFRLAPLQSFRCPGQF